MVIIKSSQEIRKIHKSCQIAANTLQKIMDNIREGITTLELNQIAEDYILKQGAKPAFKGYKVGKNEFPYVICVSINEEVVHGLPGKRRIEEGDIVSIDIGTNYQGYFGDTAATKAVGKVESKIEELIAKTQEALFKGISQAKPGNHLGDISYAIQETVEKEGFSVVREYVGHGIGLNLHEDPQIPNYGTPHTGIVLQKGMVLAIEPMVNIGDYRTKVSNNNWTVVTKDGSWSAHFEHTIVITENSNEILTLLS
ncbi:MAG: type I methionyl aminopeptidase [Candidatus Caldatribacteriota bacterium]